jgi:hypothetical protein
MTQLELELIQSIARLDSQQQQNVLTYVRSFPVQRKPSTVFRALAGKIETPELAMMQTRIHTDCNHIDATGW